MSNRIKIKYSGDAVSRSSEQQSPSREPFSNENEASVIYNNGTRISNGSFIDPFTGLPEVDIENLMNWKEWTKFYNGVKKVAYQYIGQSVEAWLGCGQSHPDKPGYQRGWMFDVKQGKIFDVKFVECGCYREAIWPQILGLGLIVKTLVSSVIIKRLRRIALKDFLNKCGDIVIGRGNYRKALLSIRKLGIDPGNIRLGKAARTLELPPVPAGHVRLFRAQDNHNLAQLVTEGDPSGTGRWFTTNPQNAVGYISRDLLPGADDLSFAGKYPNGHIVYVDVPENSITPYKIAGSPNGYQFLTETPPPPPTLLEVLNDGGAAYRQKIQEWGDANNIEIITSSIVNETTGEVFYAAPQNYHFALDTNIVRTTSDGTSYTIPRPTVLRRNNKLVLDVPGPNDIRDNPKIYAWSETAGSQELFMPIDVCNQAKKIAGVGDLSDIDEFEDIFNRIQNYAYFKDENGEIYGPYIIPPDKTTDPSGYKFWIEDTPEGVGKKLLAAGEEFLKKSSIRSEKIAEWNSIMDDLKRLRTTHLDALPEDLQKSIEFTESLLQPGSPVIQFWDDFAYLLVFIESVMALTRVVEDKYCGPKAYQYSIVGDVIKQIGVGLTPGYRPAKMPHISTAQWDSIREQIINDDGRIFWAELDENCNCHSCPDSWILCGDASPTDFIADYYNTCYKCQQCEDDIFEPVYAEYSKIPIILSHRSEQINNGYCACFCPPGDIPRLDKNGQNTITGNRILRDVAQTGNAFEDANCINYIDKNVKINVDTPLIKIKPSIGEFIPGIPFQTEIKYQVCDYSDAPDGLPESSIFPWVSTSAYEWSPTLGRWKCKETKECESPQVFTEGVGDNGQYCDCVTVTNEINAMTSLYLDENLLVASFKKCIVSYNNPIDPIIILTTNCSGNVFESSSSSSSSSSQTLCEDCINIITNLELNNSGLIASRSAIKVLSSEDIESISIPIIDCENINSNSEFNNNNTNNENSIIVITNISLASDSLILSRKLITVPDYSEAPDIVLETENCSTN